MVARTVSGGSGDAGLSYIRYLNQNATRNKPLSPELASALGFLPELGVTAEVFSGGQDGIGQGDRRTGSVRHDHGNAADVFFSQNGRRLDWATPEDRPVFEEIVRRGKANGISGFGAGDGYMAPASMHIGFGAPGVWGAGGRGANAPDWLRQAYGEAPAGGVPVQNGGGQEVAYGNARNDDLTKNPMPENVGGLGGLGGFVHSEGFGDVLSAFGTSLLTSPSNNPFQNFGEALDRRQEQRFRKEALDEKKAEREADQQAMETVLRSRGFTAEEARAYSRNPAAANLAIDQRKEAMVTARGNATADHLEPKYPDLAEAIRSGAMTGADAWRESYTRDKAAREAPSGYRVSQDGATLEYIPGGPADPSVAGRLRSTGSSGNAPSGFRWADDGKSLEPIPGGPGEQIGGENAGRIGIAQSFLQDLPSIRESVGKGEITGGWDATVGRMGFGQQGRLYARIESGADALQRMLSGAGMPESEAAAYARRYMPSATDSAEIVAQKLDQMERELNNQMAIVMRGRGGRPGAIPGGAAPAVTSGSSSGLGWSVK